MPLFKLQITFAIVTTIHADSVYISKRHSWIHIHTKRCLVSVVLKCCLAFSHSLLCCQCTLSSKNHIKYILCEVLSTSEIDNLNEKTLYCQLQDIAQCTHTSTYIHIMAVDLRHLMESFIAEWLYAICKKNESTQIIKPSERITNSLIARHEKSLSSFKKRV